MQDIFPCVVWHSSHEMKFTKHTIGCVTTKNNGYNLDDGEQSVVGNPLPTLYLGWWKKRCVTSQL